MMKMYQGWDDITDMVIDNNDIARFVNGYYKSNLSEEAYGAGYLRELMKKHPEYSGHIKDLLNLPGTGAYVTHWFLDKSGAICR